MAKALPLRSEIDSKYKWQVEDIYESWDKWETDYRNVVINLKKFADFKGNLNDGKTLLECLQLRDELAEKLGKVFTFTSLKRDEDTSNTEHQNYYQKAESLYSQAMTATSFITPEILSLGEEKVTKLMEQEPKLKFYDFYLENILREAPHTLSIEEERLLSLSQELNNGPASVFGMFNNADIQFPLVTDENGEKVELSHGRYVKFLMSKDRRVRKEAFEAMYSTYEKFKNTLAANYSARIKGDIFYAKARKHNNSLDAALFPDNIPEAVYYNVVDTINKHIKSLHRYVSLKKKMLGLDKLHMYDVYTPLASNISMDIPYEEAKKMVLKGCEKLGDEYTSIMKKGLEEGWVDVYENKGKRSGAYSSGSYGTKPYILLNYDDTLNSTSTLAHELGHSIHSYLSQKNQPFTYSRYNIFAAEVASTVNEALLNDYLMKTNNDKEKRFYIINQYLEAIRGTVFRQSMFAEFELKAHELVEEGNPVTAEALQQLWIALNEKYFGPDAVIDEPISMEWARIPHFYRSYYVFKYVTGFSAATSIAEDILQDKPNAIENYMSFLKGGGSDYAMNLLKNAGVDMTEPDPIEKTIDVFNRLMDELEELI
ncbi:oligoendopeptidase F [Proteinivorax hydrogeniformans]|uniref:Oligopeptidase F n=1 Tax=Proteinivorax hydrogeniformans TaxID=1826727 RepID=A0AAU8HUU4_9FIRM